MKDWISVNDRLPEKDVNVLCYTHGDIVEGYLCSNDNVFKPEIDCIGYMQNDVMVIDVTHWMPLPEPPKI